MSVQAPAVSDLRQQVHDAARRARVAARELATLEHRDEELGAARRGRQRARATRRRSWHANAEDLAAAKAAGTPEAMLDRLALNPQRIDGIAAGLRQVAGSARPDR